MSAALSTRISFGVPIGNPCFAHFLLDNVPSMSLVVCLPLTSFSRAFLFLLNPLLRFSWFYSLIGSLGETQQTQSIFLNRSPSFCALWRIRRRRRLLRSYPRFLVRIPVRPFISFHPFEGSELLPDLSRKYNILSCISTNHCNSLCTPQACLNCLHGIP